MRISYLTKQFINNITKFFLIDICLFLFAIICYFVNNIIFSILGSAILFILAYKIYKNLKKIDAADEGEVAVRVELGKLPAGYYKLQDFNYANRNSADFVVIGHTGIYTIEVKSYKTDKVTFKNDLLCNGNGIPFKKDILKQARDEGSHLHHYIKEAGLQFEVKPVVVFANKSTEIRFGLVPKNGVYVVGIDWVNKLILNHNSDVILTPEQCSNIRNLVNEYSSII